MQLYLLIHMINKKKIKRGVYYETQRTRKNIPWCTSNR